MARPRFPWLLALLASLGVVGVYAAVSAPLGDLTGTNTDHLRHLAEAQAGRGVRPLTATGTRW
ncbi:MAG: hypothetical protein ACOZQL_00130 [Myxococcota bacterium]